MLQQLEELFCLLDTPALSEFLEEFIPANLVILYFDSVIISNIFKVLY